MNSIVVTTVHSLFHMNRHYNLLHFPNTVETPIIDTGIQLSKLSFDEYLLLKKSMQRSPNLALFRWDN